MHHAQQPAHIYVGSAWSCCHVCAGEYLVLQLQESALKHEVRYEAAAPVGDKASKNFSNDSSADVQTFPHLYGAINSDAVTAELSVARSADGTFEGIEGI